MLTRFTNDKGFTLIELMVVIVLIGILAAVAIPRYMGSQNRARIAAAEAELNSMRQGLGLYSIDNAKYPSAIASYDALKDSVVDPVSGEPYIELPDGSNFTWVSYTASGTNDSTYTLVITAKDNQTSTLTGTPEGITK